MRNSTLALAVMVLTLIAGSCSRITGADHPGKPLTVGLEAGFRNPPDEVRPGTFWYWINGNITEEGITADLEAMARVGIRSVLFMEVLGDIDTGSVASLGPEWRRLFKHAVTEAGRLGLTVRTTASSGYSGSGGPWVSPEHSMQKLVSTQTRIEGGRRFSEVLPQPQAVAGFYRDIAVLAMPDDSKIWARGRAVDLSARMDTDGRLSWDVPEGQWTVLRIGHTSNGRENHPAPVSGTGLECDKLSREALDAHFEGFMGKLIADVGPLAGEVFTHAHVDSWEVGSQNWTAKFPEEFERRRGYDPLPFLPAQLGRVVDDPAINARFLWDFRMTVSDLVLDHFASGMREQAHKHGMQFSLEGYGQGGADHRPFVHQAFAGRSDMPMGEFWVDSHYIRSCKEMTSASHVYGKPITGAEAFTARPPDSSWKNHPYAIKAIGDFAFCEGINQFIFHVFAHQPWLDREPGMSFGAWGTHFTRNQTWWEQSRAWHDYLARSQFMLQQGLFQADICYLDLEDAPRRTPDRRELDQLRKGFKKRHTPRHSFDKLNPDPPSGYDYDICPPEVAHTRMTVRDGRIVLPDGMNYRLLVMPPTTKMTPQTLGKVRDLVKAGATIVASQRPTESPSLQNYPACDDEVKAIARELFGDDPIPGGSHVVERRVGAGRVLLTPNMNAAMAALEILRDVEFAGVSPKTTLRWIHRRTEDAEIYFVANLDQHAAQFEGVFRVRDRLPELWHPETGEIRDLPDFKPEEGRTRVPLRLGPAESVFVVFRKPVPATYAGKGRNWLEFTPLQQIDGAWDLTFDPARGGPAGPVTFDALQDWSAHPETGIRYYSGIATYRKTFEIPAAALEQNGARLFLNLGRVEVIATATLNGRELATLWKPPFRVEVTGQLEAGKNTLELAVVNVWNNRLIGDEHLPDDTQWRKTGLHSGGRTGKSRLLKTWPQWLLDGKPSPTGRITFATARYHDKDDPLLPSGLLGPVTLETARELSNGER